METARSAQLWEPNRPISQYINDFMNAGFALQRTFEPEAETAYHFVPAHFGAVGQKIGQSAER